MSVEGESVANINHKKPSRHEYDGEKFRQRLSMSPATDFESFDALYRHRLDLGTGTLKINANASGTNPICTAGGKPRAKGNSFDQSQQREVDLWSNAFCTPHT